MSQTFGTQVVTDATVGVGGTLLTFSNIQVSEVDTLGAGGIIPAGAVLPLQNFDTTSASVSDPYDGLDWSGFGALVLGGVASIQLTFSYTVTVASGATITGLEQGFTGDANFGNGILAETVETVTDANGNPVATLTATDPSATATLATGYTTLHVTDVMTVSVNDTSGGFSGVGISEIDQGFALTASASSGPNPVGGGGGVNDGGGGGNTPGTIVANAFLDSNGDATQDNGELGINAVSVTLEDGSGNILQTAYTDGSGIYVFSDLTVGNYTVVFGTPAGDVATTPITDSVTVTSGGTVTENAGFAPPASFTTTVYTDANGDSSQDNGETGLSGVTVDLEDGSGNVLQVATTDANGNVAFTGLVPGSYEVAVVAPTGDVVTQQTNVTTVNTLAPGGTANAIEGVYVPATINGTAFLDANGDQTQDNGEAGIPGVTVTLLNSSGGLVGTATTNATGGYSFTGVAPGSYTVSFTTPNGDLATTPISDAVTVAAGGTATENAGFAVPASITGTTFIDNNDNGTLGVGDTDLSGVTVTLLNGTTTVGTETTGANGAYSFTGLAPGSYTVAFGTSSGLTATTSLSDTVSLPSGGSAVENAGYYAPASFTATVYTDANGDSSQDNGETGLAGVTVHLENAGGTVEATAVTNSSGNVAFTGLAPGGYEIAVVAPGGDVVTQQTNVATVNTLVSGGTANAIEGVYVPATINGTAFLDANGDQTQDNGEAGIPGVTVTLLNSSGTPIGTATTNATGGYSFTGVAPGSYTVSFTTPNGDLATTPISDAVTVAAGGTATENAGFAVPASITGTTFIDNNDNGTLGVGDTDLSGVTVTLLNGTTTVGTETTGANGAYSFTGLAPGSYTVAFGTSSGLTGTTSLSDTVSLPSGGSAVENAGYYAPASFTATVYTDANGDSSQDNGETGLAGVTVHLENAGGTVEATAVTNSSGNVAFTGLVPGSYEVAVVAPTGDAVTQQTNVVTVNTLASGGTANAVEGVYVPATINAVAFGDANDDGKQDNGETGLAGVTVSLLKGTTIVATATTNASGAYSFTGLAPGSYTVNFSTPGTDTATTPVSDAVTVTSGGTASVTAGFYAPVAAATAAITGTTFIDNNTNGVLDAGDTDLGGVTVTLLSGTTTVGTTTTNSSGAYSFTGEKAGTYTVVFTTPGGDTATTPVSDTVTLAAGGLATENAGFYAPGAIVGTTFLDNNDNGTLDAGDTDLSGVTVTLKNSSGTVVGTTTTNSSGGYSFTGEKPGTYTVVFTTPSGDTATTSVSDTATVLSGGTVTENAGFYAPGTINGTAYTDKNGDGTQDNGETGLSCVTVTLKNASGAVVGTTTTNSSGGYSFTGEKPGVYTVVFSTPNGDMATTPVTDTVTLTAGGTITENAGFAAPASITGTTFIDKNGNGTLDCGDTDLSGVTVTLLSGTTTVGTTTTNSSGGYSFTGEKPGVYTVVFSTPTGDTATTPVSDTVTLTAGGSVVENAGFMAPGAIVGTTFMDNNDNGTLDCGDTDLSGVTVTLKNASGTVVGTTTTNSNGAYSFTGEQAGTYTVVFTTPTGDTATTPVSDTVTVTSGGTVTENAGFYQPSAIVGTAFTDKNGDGTQDNGETGLAGVTVTLKNSCGTVVGTTTTNSTGGYSFTGEKAGTYTVVFSTPTGDMATTSVSDTVTLTAGGTITENAGFTVPASITGTTFADNNDNGVLDAGDTDLSGVTVTLKSGTTTVATTTTNSSGAYSFTGEKAGTYTVVFSTPTGDTATTPLSDTVTLTSGGSAVENAGFYALAAINGTAYSDKNGDSCQDNGETGLAGVTVTLKNSSGTVVGTTTTNSSGGYSFTGEKPGTYTVVFTTPSGDVATTPVSDTVTLTAGGTITENAGFYAACGNNGTASITGEVWNDVNATGTLNCGESGLSGVTVDLLNSTGTAVLATTTTNSSGNYSFGKLSAGSYEIKVIAPTGDTFSPEVSGSCGAVTSEVSPSNGVSSVITLSGCGSATVDAGVHAIIAFASGCGTGGGGCGGGGYGGGGGCGSSESSNTNICGWSDGCEDNGGFGSGYGSCWTYDSACGDYHNESGCSGQSASTSPITPFASISLSDTANVAVKITLTGLNGVVTDADGTLSGKGLTKTGVGTYTLASASTATMTAEMQALVFTPTANQVAPGLTVTTGFDVVATDANGYTDSDATTKVTVTATDTGPKLTQQTITCSVGDGGTLQNLWSEILGNCSDSDVGNQAKITICSVGQSNTCGFLNYNGSDNLLTYTADGCAPGKTDAFTYTVTDPNGVSCTGTVDIAVTGGSAPTTVSTSCNSTLTVSNSNGCFDSLGTNNKLNVSGNGNQVYGGGGNNTFTVYGANNTIYGGDCNDTINISNSGNTAVLSLGGCDTINGASLTNGTKLNLDTVLAQCDVQGATLSNVSQYFSVACSGSNATLLYNGPGCGNGGSAVAVLNGIGYNTSLNSLVSHNVLQV